MRTAEKEKIAERPQVQNTEETQAKAENASTEIVVDEGLKRKIIAFTVGAVVFLFMLIVLMCYQMVCIGVNSRKKAELTEKIAELDKQHEHGEGEIAFRRSSLYIERIARELGYHYADDE